MSSSANGALDVTASRGLGRWLKANETSFAFTSYQSGQLFLVGAHADGTVSINQQFFQRAMGLAWRPGRLYLAGQFQLWRLENMLRPGETANRAFDALLVPRNAQTTGDLDIHEIGVDRHGRVIFVNTSFSCLATLDLRHSFRAIWKPPFISRLAAEDRCHLNGMALGERGEPRYVTALSQTDVVTGWRERKAQGGVLIEVDGNRIVTEQLSMPHSPRIAGEHVYLLDSGRGYLVRVDPKDGSRTDVAFCPGFLRGLAIHNGHALVTVSKPREGLFKDLPLQDELNARDGESWCGVLLIDLARGDVVEWLKFGSSVEELFDVVAMPGIRCPMAIGPASAEIQQTISFDPVIAPMPPLAA
ncbi:MAG TPA: TIGR03032 family protein [Reyranellaceae bacterium]|nr:TIGR03032 family protein [Reyranellaceae bacterium]